MFSFCCSLHQMIKMNWIPSDTRTYRGRCGLLALIILISVLSTVYLYPYLPVIEQVLQPAAMTNRVEDSFKPQEEQPRTTGSIRPCLPAETLSERERYYSSLAARVNNASIGTNNVCPTRTLADRGLILQDMMKGADLKQWPGFDLNFRSPCFYTKGGPKCLPYVYVAGVAKSGTSRLFSYLLRHRDILQPAMREEAFFSSSGANFWDLVDNFKMASYAAYFDRDERGCHRKLIAAANPLMFTINAHTWPSKRGIDSDPKCSMAHTLHAMVPKARIIVTLREPVMRLLSHFHQSTTPRGALLPELFHNNVLQAISIMQTCLAKRTLRSCIFDTAINKQLTELHVFLHLSMYYPFAVEWLSAFPVTQIYFIKADECYQKAGEVMADVFRFLQLDTPAAALADIQAMGTWKHHMSAESERQNTSYHNDLWDITRKVLQDFYEPYNRQLATLLDDDKWLFRTSH